MSIVYKAQRMDANGCHVDSWNPSGDYADNEYAKVWFRTDCPAYRSGHYYMQFDTADERKAFYNEVAGLLIALGWTVGKIEPDAYGSDAAKGKAHLYVHPDSLSGSVLKKDIRMIAEALGKGKTFSHGMVDVYEDVFDYTDDEYREYLETRADDIRAFVLSYSRTSRRSLYCSYGEVALRAGLHVRRKRIGKTDGGVINGDKMETAVVNAVIDELIDAGYLVQPENRKDLIRTINKTERKQRKLYIGEVA